MISGKIARVRPATVAGSILDRMFYVVAVHPAGLIDFALPLKYAFDAWLAVVVNIAQHARYMFT